MYDYEFSHGGRRRRPVRWLLGGTALIGIASLAAGAYVLGVQTGSTRAGAGEQSRAPAAVAPPPSETATMLPSLDPPVPAEPDEDPVATGVAWLRAYWSRSHSDPSPSAWIDRVLPVAGDELAEEYESYRDGSPGAYWADFVAAQCVSAVEDAGGVVPAEAPRTRTTVNVLVTGTLRTECQGDKEGQRPGEPVAASLRLVKADDGLWRVDQRLF